MFKPKFLHLMFWGKKSHVLFAADVVVQWLSYVQLFAT